MKKGLLESLRSYSESDFYPFHMPGHKRKMEKDGFGEICRYDITEIDGFDNLHNPQSILKEAEERAAELYCSEETYYLINGSTSGILSAVSAVAGRARGLIIARNCHRAVYHAAFLNHMELHYVYPEIINEYDIAGSVSAEDLECVIKGILNKAGAESQRAGELIAGAVITSPTYDGISSDIRKIANLLHEYGIPLIVDQAHGAHFGMHPAYPENAVKQGADYVIHSVHKTLPAPTQTALLHRNGALTDSEVLKKYLRIYQSSSPSYVLMAGIDEAVRIAKEEGCQRLEHLLRLRADFVKKIKKCRCIRICPLTEPGKLIVSVKGTSMEGNSMTGQMLYDILRNQYHLQMEMASANYVTAILSMMDEEEGMNRLADALIQIDKGIIEKKEQDKVSDFVLRPVRSLHLWEAYLAPFTEIELDQADGKTAAEFINLYPPGIPILVPGEMFDEGMIKMIQLYLKDGYTVQGIFEHRVRVVESP
ncbi:MAG: aminotransferase class I/II-fold pyridoxal phosphate-dependent enzyme [Lachnospiraceae bacterium]|nr:aminotransferase class I/II-fold pyridoxal phosphate-dependent enzyme [Lachnospiraceae bacterium]MDE6185741.1 aminotransferase class I/II-fold pyridoxal phosphate-dependent enzyme [Lachnospiraceae bacterium]